MTRVLLRLSIGLLLTILFFGGKAAAQAPSPDTAGVKPIHALLITGGGFHDYERQKQILTEGISARANVQWTIFQENGDANHELSIYNTRDWAKDCDVVVHNECFADVIDPVFIEKILAAHRNGAPAVVIHCTLHTFQALKTDQWREFLGVTTHQHGRQLPIEIRNIEPGNPIMKEFPPVWTTGPEELYQIDKIWPNTHPLALGSQADPPKNAAVIWTNTYGGARVFGTSLAHNDATMADPVYLGMLTRGLLWACDKLGPDGRPKPGYGPMEKK